MTIIIYDTGQVYEVDTLTIYHDGEVIEITQPEQPKEET